WQRILPKLKLEMGALASEQWPEPANPITVIWAPVRVLAIAVLVIPAIGDAERSFDPEQSLRHPRRVFNPGIVGTPQAKPYQVEVLHPDQGDGGHRFTPSVRHVHATAQATLHRGRSDPHVVAVNSKLARIRPFRHVRPVLDTLVPAVGERKNEIPFLAGKE